MDKGLINCTLYDGGSFEIRVYSVRVPYDTPKIPSLYKYDLMANLRAYNSRNIQREMVNSGYLKTTLICVRS